MAPPPHRSISKTMGHDIDDRCDVDIDSIDAIEDRNRWLDFDIDSIRFEGRFDSIRFDFPPQRHLCGRGFLGILFFKMRHAAFSSSFRYFKRSPLMQILPRCAWRLSLNDSKRKLAGLLGGARFARFGLTPNFFQVQPALSPHGHQFLQQLQPAAAPA